MTLQDVGIILKKILVGIILVIVPALILWGGLRLTIKLLSQDNYSNTVSINPK